jgi:hypothetical protein
MKKDEDAVAISGALRFVWIGETGSPAAGPLQREASAISQKGTASNSSHFEILSSSSHHFGHSDRDFLASLNPSAELFPETSLCVMSGWLSRERSDGR